MSSLILSIATVLEIVPLARPNIARFIQSLNETMGEFDIDTPLRMAMFLAQVAHETGSFAYTAEIADGSAYEGRKDLGNVEPGDGPKFKGRGLLQVTGRSNYAACSKRLSGREVLLLENPELLADDPVFACRSAGWYWTARDLKRYADHRDIMGATRVINGGLNGIRERSALYSKALRVLTRREEG